MESVLIEPYGKKKFLFFVVEQRTHWQLRIFALKCLDLLPFLRWDMSVRHKRRNSLSSATFPGTEVGADLLPCRFEELRVHLGGRWCRMDSENSEFCLIKWDSSAMWVRIPTEGRVRRLKCPGLLCSAPVPGWSVSSLLEPFWPWLAGCTHTRGFLKHPSWGPCSLLFRICLSFSVL